MEYEYGYDTASETASETSSIFSNDSTSTAASSLPELDPVDAFITAGLAWAARNRYTYSGTHVPNPTPPKYEKMEYEHEYDTASDTTSETSSIF